MKTVRFHQTGGPEVLVFEDVPEPTPGPDEVLIRVEAVGMNFADILRRRGDPYPEPSPMPMTVGSEVAGTVIALGSHVTGISLGSLVYAACRIGGYAQFVAVSAKNVIPLPNGVTAIEATTLVVQGLTALFALREAGRLARGESVLIEAAAGGVGSFAVQLAKILGAGRVIAAASTAKKREFAITLGADDAVDYTEPTYADRVKSLTGGRGVDLVLEMTGGLTFHRSLESLAPFGRMVVYGLASGEAVTIDPQVVVASNQSIVGFYIGGYFQRPDAIRQGLQELVDHVVAGRVSLQVGTVLPLEMAAEAHRLLEGRFTTGKVVLQPWAS